MRVTCTWRARPQGGTAHAHRIFIAKIERLQALENVRSIAGAADGLMAARGDLA
ncbi:MAG: pyruvate kinase [Thermomicrobiales bacterium]